MTIDDFKEMYQDAVWLESVNGYERWSNGLEEGTEHESLWFDENGDECQRPDF